MYGYYPYTNEISDVNHYPISVEATQSGDSKVRNVSAYEASDFLWAKSTGLTAANPNTILYFKHLLASVRVTLTEGEGFENGEWNTLDKFVTVNNTARNAHVDLATGEVTCTGVKDGINIIACQDRGDFRAIVVPQTVDAGDVLLNITVGNHTYKFIRNVKMEYMQGKQHNFTIEVKKNTKNGDFDFLLVDESITRWESDLISHNGEAKEYIVINLKEGGSLEASLEENGFDPKEIRNLKLTGPMNENDFEFIRNKTTNLEAINLRDADLSKCKIQNTSGYALPNYAFLKMTSLRRCVFPQKLKGIGRGAFYGTSLSGNLDIPEGVEVIDGYAFCSNSNVNGIHSDFGLITQMNNLTGVLTLPSTIKSIGDEAFSGCDFSGPLLLPDGLEEIGNAAFANCQFFSGDIHVPESVVRIGSACFSGMKGINGWITLPSNLKNIESETFSYLDITGIEWPDNLISIGSRAFYGSTCRNDIKIPESVISMGEACFYKAKVKHVILPPNITRVPSYFLNNENSNVSNGLRDTLYSTKWR